jgi:hypothetical protein
VEDEALDVVVVKGWFLLDVDDRRKSFAFSLVDHRRSDMLTASNCRVRRTQSRIDSNG